MCRRIFSDQLQAVVSVSDAIISSRLQRLAQDFCNHEQFFLTRMAVAFFFRRPSPAKSQAPPGQREQRPHTSSVGAMLKPCASLHDFASWHSPEERLHDGTAVRMLGSPSNDPHAWCSMLSFTLEVRSRPVGPVLRHGESSHTSSF